MEKHELALVRDEDLDLQSWSGIAEAKRRGLLPDRSQSREDCEREAAAFMAERFAELQSDERRPARRLGLTRTGVYTSQVRRRGGEWSRPRVVAVGRGSAAAALPGRSRGPRGTVRRPRARRRTTRARAPSRDSSGSGEPGPGPDDGPGRFTQADARHVAEHVGALCPRTLRPSDFYAITRPFLRGLDPEQLGPARLATFLELAEVQRQSYWRLVAHESDAAHLAGKAGGS